MPRSLDAQLTSPMDLTAATTAAAVAAPITGSAMPEISQPPPGCTCQDYLRDKVCDHVLMAAAVRMVRRMIDIHAEPEKAH
jgi:hypothetical protein